MEVCCFDVGDTRNDILWDVTLYNSGTNLRIFQKNMLPPYSVKNGKFQRDYTVLHFKRQYSSTYESVMGKLHWMIFFCMFRKLNISRTWNNAKRQCPHCSYSQWGVQLRPKGTYTATVIFFSVQHEFFCCISQKQKILLSGIFMYMYYKSQVQWQISLTQFIFNQ